MKIKRILLYFSVIAVIVLAAVFFYYGSYKESRKTEKDAIKEEYKNPWQVDKDGYLSYPLNRGKIKFSRENYSETENLSVSRIIFQSTRGNIYGLLVLPKSASELMPGVVLLPAIGVSKESELRLAKKIAGLGAAVLTIDQRGVGETGGRFPNLDEDYAGFLEARETYQHLMVYDALKAYDLLHSAPFIDADRIIIVGESLGGRIGLIAAAIDRNIKGVIAISSAGLDFRGGSDQKKNAFLNSVDSDHYIGLITPRKIVMIHNSNDKRIPLKSALNSFSIAQEPKQFVLVNDTSCNHGYCDSMYIGLSESLDYLVGIRTGALFSVSDRNKK